MKKVRFEHRAVRAQSVQRALFGKELRRFTASPNYMLNCGLGILMLPVAGIVLLIKGGALGRMLADVFSGNVGVVPVLMCAAVCLLASMNDMAAPPCRSRAGSCGWRSRCRSYRGRRCARSWTCSSC